MNMIKNRKCSSSLSNKQHSISSIEEPNVDAKQVQEHLKVLYHTLKNYYQQKTIINDQEIKFLYKEAVSGIKKFNLYKAQTDQTIFLLKQQINKQKEQHDIHKRNILQNYQEQLKFMDSQNNQKIINLNAQFGRKEQTYKQLILSFIDSLSNAQRTWSSSFNQLYNKTQTIVSIVQSSSSKLQENQFINDTISQLVCQLNIPREQDSIMSRKTQQLSSMCQEGSPRVEEHKRNIIDMSSIEQLQVDDYMCPERDVEQCLQTLIKLGFFGKENRKNVETMLNICERLDNDQQLLDDGIYPLVVEFLKVNIREKQQSQQEQDFSKLELRNIQNLSELSISQNPIQEIKFKKKKIILS